MNIDHRKPRPFDVARWLKIEEACANFEHQLRAGQQPRIELFLTDHPEPFRSHLLMDLLRLEFEHRIANNGSCDIREYLERFPGDESLVRATRDELDFERESRRIDEDFGSGQSTMVERYLENQPGFRRRHNRLKELIALEQMRSADIAAVILEPESGNASYIRGHQIPAESDHSRYQVRDEVARGGMGIIYRVRDSELNRTLAMKVVDLAPNVSSDNSSTRILSRFLEEAQVTAQLDHPGIVAVHELGIDDADRPFFTMKLVKGQEFSKIVELVLEQRESWNLSRAIAVMVKVCQTIAYAHSRKVIHRDLKPANIMVGRLGEVYVMDWGLAKIVGREDLHDIRFVPETQAGVSELQTPRTENKSSTAESPLITMDGAVVGTPAYMSPEQARGDIAAVDYQSDVYSLGAVLYHLLTGHPPYVERGTTISPRTVLARVLDGPPKAISELIPDAAPELVAICDKAMARDKDRRYQSSEELAEDLQAFLDHRVVRAYQTGAAAELKAWVLRNRLAAVLIASLLAIGLCFIGWKTYTDRENAIKLRDQLARQYFKTGQALCEQGRIDHGLHWFARSWHECPARAGELKANIAANLNGWRLRCNRLLQVMETEAIGATDAQLGDGSVLAFSPNGKRLVTGGLTDRPVRIWSVDSGAIIGEMRHKDVQGVYFAQDGREIVTVSRDGTIGRWSDQGKELIEPIQLGKVPIATAFFDAPEPLVFIGSDDGSVTVWSVITGQFIGHEMKHGHPVTCLGLSPDGTLLAVGYSDNTTLLWSVESRQSRETRWVHNGPINSVAFSPDGAIVATGSADSTARLWSVETGQATGLPLQHRGSVNRVAFSPVDARVATASADGTAVIWSTENGAPVKPPLQHLSAVITLAYSIDGSVLLTGTHGMIAKIWSAHTGLEIGNDIKHQGPITEIEVNPKGVSMAISSAGKSEIWSVDVLPYPVQRFPGEPTDWKHPESETFKHTKRVASVHAMAWNENGSAVVIAGLGSKSVLWSESGEKLRELHGPSCWDAAFNPKDETWMLGDIGNFEATIWNSDGHRLRAFAHELEVRSVAFSADGKLAATGSFDKRVQVWDVERSVKNWSLENRYVVEDLAFSRDGTTLITACNDSKVRFLSTENGQSILEPPIAHDDAVLALDLSPNGKLIATGGRDHTVRFWDSRTGRPAGPVLEHAHWVEDIAFSPDSRSVITACNDGNAQLWSVVSGEKLGPPFPHEYPLRVVTFHPSGDRVLTGGRGREARLWKIPNTKTSQVVDFELFVQILTGKKMDENGVMSRLTHKEWRELRAKQNP